MTSVWMEGVRRKESARNQPRVQPIGSLGGLWSGLQLVWNRRTGSLEIERALMARCVNVIKSPALLQTGRAKLAFFLGQKIQVDLGAAIAFSALRIVLAVWAQVGTQGHTFTEGLQFNLALPDA